MALAIVLSKVKSNVTSLMTAIEVNYSFILVFFLIVSIICNVIDIIASIPIIIINKHSYWIPLQEKKDFPCIKFTQFVASN